MTKWGDQRLSERKARWDADMERMRSYYRKAKEAFDANEDPQEQIANGVYAWADACDVANKIHPRRGFSPREQNMYDTPQFRHNFQTPFLTKLIPKVVPNGHPDEEGFAQALSCFRECMGNEWEGRALWAQKEPYAFVLEVFRVLNDKQVELLYQDNKPLMDDLLGPDVNGPETIAWHLLTE